ncbi:MAG TPA: hypothetical protein V6D20_23970 [Candidatus Obscuribacterales bacterium]
MMPCKSYDDGMWVGLMTEMVNKRVKDLSSRATIADSPSLDQDR